MSEPGSKGSRHSRKASRGSRKGSRKGSKSSQSSERGEMARPGSGITPDTHQTPAHAEEPPPMDRRRSIQSVTAVDLMMRHQRTPSILDDAPSLISSRAESMLYWNNADVDLVVLPSLTVDAVELRKITGVNHYEERMLFNLMLLSKPQNRVIYFTSEPMDPSIIEYYLTLLPNVSLEDYRRRLILVSAYDSTSRSLSEKLLERPRLLDRVKKLLRPGKAAMSVFVATELEALIASALGDIPVLGNDYTKIHWGTKSGSRQAFVDAGVPLPRGIDPVRSEEDLIESMAKFWGDNPDVKRIVVKLEESFSGEGNALMDLRPHLVKDRAPDNHGQRRKIIAAELPKMSFAGTDEHWNKYRLSIPRLGVIAEEWIEGDKKTSPSAQFCIDRNGKVECLSTHEQILGGPDGAIYLGCRFPAAEGYRTLIQNYGKLVGDRLYKDGVMDHYAVDFIARPIEFDEAGNPTQYEAKALEINLRLGGTTHPMMALKLLNEGGIDEETGKFIDRSGVAKYYVASDNVKEPHYRGLMPKDVTEMLLASGLAYNHATGSGVVMHLLGALSEFGKIGITCIANSMKEADQLHEQFVAMLEAETKGDKRHPRLPPYQAPKSAPPMITAPPETAEASSKRGVGGLMKRIFLCS